MIAQLPPDCDESEISRRLGRVYGVTNFGIGLSSSTDLDDLKSTTAHLMADVSYETFAISTRRADKRFPLKSTDVNQELGALVLEKFGGRVNLDAPELKLHVEIMTDGAILYIARHLGPGGLPVGVSGRVLVLLSGGIDSPVAAQMMHKRGSQVDFVHFHSFPYTSKASQDKVVDLARIVCECQPRSRLFLVPIADIQKEIVTEAPPALRVLLYRRYMGLLAERVAETLGALALVTGESLGQVASQTLENLLAVEAGFSMSVLRPLVGFDKQEIVELARRQGTFGVSIEPHDDCCSYLMPRHPATKARAADLDAAMDALDVDDLMTAALDAAEEITLAG